MYFANKSLPRCFFFPFLDVFSFPFICLDDDVVECREVLGTGAGYAATCYHCCGADLPLEWNMTALKAPVTANKYNVENMTKWVWLSA